MRTDHPGPDDSALERRLRRFIDARPDIDAGVCIVDGEYTAQLARPDRPA